MVLIVYRVVYIKNLISENLNNISLIMNINFFHKLIIDLTLSSLSLILASPFFIFYNLHLFVISISRAPRRCCCTKIKKKKKRKRYDYNIVFPYTF